MRRRRIELPLSRVEEAELRRLVYRAFAVRNGDAEEYRAALQAIEDWHFETLPLASLAPKAGGRDDLRPENARPGRSVRSGCRARWRR